MLGRATSLFADLETNGVAVGPILAVVGNKMGRAGRASTQPQELQWSYDLAHAPSPR
jgi:hypothetical protein